MSTLPRQIAWDHCPVYDPTPGRRFEGCKCGAQVTGQAHQEHVVEVTEAAVRERVAAEIEAEEHTAEEVREQIRAGYGMEKIEGFDSGIRTAARIARGEVAA